ncbi:MAG: GGDEF domain-containing protein [Lachnospiraceae bacterium]|nr:GGDEF domain-containing protein [Lachnospiraceae bacterium]
MNLQAIWLGNIVGFILIGFLFISRFITRTKAQAEEKIFNIMLWISMAACLVEPITFTIDGKPGVFMHWLNLFGNTYLYFANGFGSFLFCIYVDRALYQDESRIKKIYSWLFVFSGVLLTTLFLNIFFGYYFYVDADNVYHRQPLIYIFYIYLITCVFISIVIVSRYKFRYGEKAFFPIFMFLGPILVGSLLQMVFYGLSLAWVGTAIGAVALYMSLQNQKMYIDSLTGLFNRMYLEHYIYASIQSYNSSYYGIMIDMNYFKEINDTYGHSAGDRALVMMAQILKNNADIYTTIFRFAGDEFIVIIKTDTENDVTHFERSIRADMQRFNDRNEEPFKLSASMGHSKYDRQNDTEDDFFKRIDAAMYIDKERIHKADGR